MLVSLLFRPEARCGRNSIYILQKSQLKRRGMIQVDTAGKPTFYASQF